MKQFLRYVVILVLVIAVLLCVARFYKGGEHFKNVALVCYGFFIGWLSAAFNFLLRKS